MSLDPDAAAHLARLREAAPPPLESGTPAQARAAHEAGAPALAGPGEPVALVEDREVAGVPVRAYRPEGAVGTTVYAHGGGWVVGTLDTYDTVCRSLALRSGSEVLSVAYDLAPEARHPVAAQQVLAVAAAQEAPYALAGDSAGAHLATLAATGAVARHHPPRALALVYPVVRPALDTASADENAWGYGLTTDAMRWYWSHYLPERPADPPVDLLALDLVGLPPTLVLTAGFDPLRDEGEDLAAALEAARVDVTRVPYDGQVHGFFRFLAVVRQARSAHEQVGAFLRERLQAG